MALLEIERLHLAFEGIEALREVSLAVEPGQVLSLVGPNGAGKTTLFNCIGRICHQDRGEIRFAGREISGLRPHQVARLGIARTFQNLQLFAGLSALENVLLGCHLHSRASLAASLLWTRQARRAEVASRQAAEEVIDLLALEGVRHRPAGDLPYGLRKRVELARALALRPSLLLLDEPAAGLSTEEREELAWWIGEIRGGLGVTVFLVEHDMRFVMDLSDRVCVLDHGEVIAQGPPAAVQQDPRVAAAYLGG
ncbi:MAG: ABC transporter ATP-binding protein [Candidatus Latescibacterota bacterium]